MTLDTTTPPEAAQAMQVANDAFAMAEAYTIDSPEMFEAAGAELRDIATRRKEIEDKRMSLTRPLDEAKKRMIEFFRAPIERLAEAEARLRGGLLAYQNAERAKAEAVRREAEEAAHRERVEIERKRRVAADAERAAREAADAARKAGDAVAAAAAESAAMDAAMAGEQAMEAAELAEIAPVALPAVAAPKAAGVSTRKTWKAEVTDLRALVLAAAKRAEAGDDFLLGFLLPNDKAVGMAAKAMQSKLVVPGVRVYAEESLSVRRAA